MPIYVLEIKGQETPRMVKADTAAQARNHAVTATGITVERMAELIEAGVVLEKADAAPAGEEAAK